MPLIELYVGEATSWPRMKLTWLNWPSSHAHITHSHHQHTELNYFKFSAPRVEARVFVVLVLFFQLSPIKIRIRMKLTIHLQSCVVFFLSSFLSQFGSSRIWNLTRTSLLSNELVPFSFVQKLGLVALTSCATTSSRWIELSDGTVVITSFSLLI